MIHTEQILEDAEVAAIYFRALIDKGVSVQAAIQMTSSYVWAKRSSDTANETPREPWQGPETQ